MNKPISIMVTLAIGSVALISAQDVESVQKANELEPVVISDSKFELKREQSGKVITTITQEELENSQGQSIATILNRVSGVFINGSNSAAGERYGVYIRGGRGREVVVRIDGVTVSDPSSSEGDFDLRLLSTNQIESIEILKGASSTLYGSGAATAVINIYTKAAGQKKVAAQFSSSLGTNQSQENQNYDISEFFNQASVNGTVGKVTYLASVSNQATDGLSAAEVDGKKMDIGESDAFSRYNVNAKLGYIFNDDVKFHLFGNLDQLKSDYDNGAAMDADNQFESRQLRAGSNLEWSYGKGSFTFIQSYALLKREFISSFPSEYESRVYTFDAYHKYEFNDTFYTVVGVNGSNSDFRLLIPFQETELVEVINDRDADFDIIDPYVNVVYVSDFGLNLNTGARYNIHSAYGTQWVYNVNPSYTYTLGDNYVKGLASYSTAYITPSLFQLYDTAFLSGNPDLKPEESRTIEAGIEFSHQKRATASVVYFDRKSDNFITFDQNTLANFNSEEEIKVDGIEVEVLMDIVEDLLKLRGNYTYTNIDRLENNIRIPKNTFRANLGYQINTKTFTSLNYQYASDRTETDFSIGVPVTLDAYAVLDFYINHQVSKNMKVFAAVNNIFNKDFQEVFGFSTRGRNVRAGLTLEF